MKRLPFIIAFTLFLYSTACFAQAGILGPNRYDANWSQAGVSGGIPSASWTQCGSSIAAYSGTATAIVNALNHTGAGYTTCGPNTFIQLMAGTFTLSTGIASKGVSNTELRGAGADQTHLVFTGLSTCAGGASQCPVSFADNNGEYPGGVTVAARWTAGYSPGATSITVSNASILSIVANQTMLVLDQADTGYSGNSTAAGGPGTTGSAVDNHGFFPCADAYNPSGPLGCSYNAPDGGGARAHRWQEETVVVTGCSPSCSNAGSTVLTINPPLIHPNWASGQAPEAWAIQGNSNIGLQNFSVDMSSIVSTSGHYGINFNDVHDFWIQGVSIKDGTQSGITAINVTRGTIQSNYIYNSGQSSNGVDPNPADPNGIGITGEAVLVQNNIVQWTRDALFMSNSSVGNVWGYNFVANCFESTSDLYPCIYDGHSAGVDFNLWEGNVADQMAQDQTHGTHLAETYFRNFISGWESCSSGNCGTLPASKTSNVDAMQPLSFNRYMNAVGNVFGTHGVHDISGALYTFTNAEWFWNGTGYGHIWNIGSGNSCSPAGGCAGGPIPIDSLVASTDMWFDNWDVKNNAAMVCTAASTPVAACTGDQRGASAPTYAGLSSPTTTLPASFYLPSGRPSWYPSSIPFPAVGPDVTSGNVGQCGGTLNTASQFAGVAATNASQCAGQGLNTAWAGHVNAIPALAAYLAHGGLPDGTGPPLSFNANTWYSSTPQAATPSFSPPAGTYGGTQSVAISTATGGAAICVTRDGSAPTAPVAGTCSGGTTFTYTTAVSVSSTTTLKVLATESGYANSPVATALYTIGTPVLAQPTYNPPGGLFFTLPSVTITPPGSAVACWTVDGSTPAASTPGTCSHGTTYSSPVTIVASGTVLKSIATQAGFLNSAETDATYTQANVVLEASSGYDGGNVYYTTVSCPAITPTAGSGLVAEVSFGTYSSIVSVTDNVNAGSYTAAIAAHYNSTIQQNIGVYYMPNAAGAATTITLTLSGLNNFDAIACQSFKSKTGGIMTLDSSATQQRDVLATANPNTGAAVAPANASTLIVGALLANTQAPSSTGAGYAPLSSFTSTGMFTQYQVQAAPTATNAPWIMASDNWTAQQAALYFGAVPPLAPINATGKLSLTGSVQLP